METRVQKWGNSLAVRLSRHIVDETNLQEGSRVAVELGRGKIVLRAVTKKEYSLRKLLSGVTRKNVHLESDFGKSAGKEVW